MIKVEVGVVLYKVYFWPTDYSGPDVAMVAVSIPGKVPTPVKLKEFINIIMQGKIIGHN